MINYRSLTWISQTASMNLEGKNMIKDFFKRLTEGKRKETKPKDFEWEKFQQTAQQQFKKLKEKGLSIPVVTF